MASVQAAQRLVRWAVATIVVATALPAGATVFLTTAEALALAFPGCAVDRQTRFMTDEEHRSARQTAAEGGESRLLHPYRATCEGRHGGTAYFDTHQVRTLPETLMVVVDPAGRVARVEVLSFREPREYSPPPPFLAQFNTRSVADPLAVKRDLRGITGATLTARAVSEAVRRVLAQHQALYPAEVTAAGR